MYELIGRVTKVERDEDDLPVLRIQLNEHPNYELMSSMSIPGKGINCDVRMYDAKTITPQQRRFIFALFRDISKSTGSEIVDVKQALIEQFSFENEMHTFSLSNCGRDVARGLIRYLIRFVLEWNIEVKDCYEYLLQDNYYFYQCLKHRVCCLCGKHADIAHVETVGIGRNRNEINHVKHHFMALCREHHQEQHKIGIHTFINRYHILPVKMSYEDLIEQGIMTRKSVEEWLDAETRICNHDTE